MHAAVPGQVVGTARVGPRERRPRVLGGDVAARGGQQPPPEQVQHAGERPWRPGPGSTAAARTAGPASAGSLGASSTTVMSPRAGRRAETVHLPSCTAVSAISTPAMSSLT